MVALGIGLLIVGFVIAVPGGALPGSAAVRNVRMGPNHAGTTPGHLSGTGGSRTNVVHTLIGVGFIAVGVILLIIGS